MLFDVAFLKEEAGPGTVDIFASHAANQNSGEIVQLYQYSCSKNLNLVVPIKEVLISTKKIAVTC